jgi:RNA polymerase sigma-54 factor
LQTCEPAGIAARDLTEALILQLNGLPRDAASTLARSIVSSHLDLLAARDFAQIKRVCKCSEPDLKAARELILSLNPRPGAQFDTTDTRYVTPDVIVRKTKTGWRASINPDAVPRLKINRMYADILSRERGRGASGEAGGLITQLQEAKWLLKNVQQRFETIERVAQAVVERQRHFLDHGEVAMRPLVLREIADELGLHESTISRVTTNKYMLTPRGLFELKYFFGSHVATDTGGACSSTAIRALIKQLVTSEDIKRPLSDSKIADILGQQGIVVARRTIAKYRDALKIPPANLRKSL